MTSAAMIGARVGQSPSTNAAPMARAAKIPSHFTRIGRMKKRSIVTSGKVVANARKSDESSHVFEVGPARIAATIVARSADEVKHVELERAPVLLQARADPPSEIQVYEHPKRRRARGDEKKRGETPHFASADGVHIENEAVDALRS